MLVLKWLHHWFPSLCARDAPLVFVNNEIRCPTCGRLLAYRYPCTRSQEGYHVYICHSSTLTLDDVQSAAIRDPPYVDPDPYGIEETIALIHTPPDDDWETEELEEGFSDPENDSEISENTVNERT